MTNDHVQEQKKAIRKLSCKARLEMDQRTYDQNNHAIFSALKTFEPLQKASHVHVYLSVEKNREVDTQPMLKWLFEHNKRVVVPVVKDSRLVSVEILPSTEYIVSSLGIREPNEDKCSELCPDIVITPLVAVDHKGNRLGYGKGYYDRYFLDLTQKSCKPVKIGLAFDFQVVNFIPTHYSEKHKDVPLDYVITQSGVIDCHKS